MQTNKNSKKILKRGPKKNKMIGRKKLSCWTGYSQIQIGDLDAFMSEVMDRFGITYKSNMLKRIERSYLSPLEIEELERIFKKYGVTENIWKDVD